MEHWYKMQVNPEQSRMVQKACFRHGIHWVAGNGQVILTKQPYLFIGGRFGLYITHTDDERVYEQVDYQEVTPEEFLEILDGYPLKD